MMPVHVLNFDDLDDATAPLAGGKAWSLARMRKAELPVPPGFCILATAYTASLNISDDLKSDVTSAYDRLGGGAVAVRSSATDEDTADASFAGQQDTFLNVEGSEALITAVQGCWASIAGDRAEAYREHAGDDGRARAMAVVVQRMAPAEKAGVLFTCSPWDDSLMVLEAAYGLGDRVVSGDVDPDRLTLRRESLSIIDREITSPDGEPCLTPEEAGSLARLGMRIEGIFEHACDIEWAIGEGKIAILQARPITATAGDQDAQKLCEQERERLRGLAASDGTIWSRYNLSEALPAPMPMTWSVVGPALSGSGGLGMAYRDMGFIPGADVMDEPPIDLICGRAYYNLTREPRMYFADFPFGHEYEEIKADPRKAQYPEPKIDVRYAPWRFWPKLPYYALRMIQAEFRLNKSLRSYDRTMNEQILPDFARYVRDQEQVDLVQLSDADVLSKIGEWRERTLDHFARDGFKATILARFALTKLTATLRRTVGDDDAGQYAQELTAAPAEDLTVSMNLDLWRLAHGEMTVDAFLERFGHRAPQEFELAQPRWDEQPGAIERFAELVRDGRDPSKRLEDRAIERDAREDELRQRLGNKWPSVTRELDFSRRYVPFRESVKHHLMMGYRLIRRGLLVLGERHLADRSDIFFLQIEELPDLLRHTDLSATISSRRRRRTQLLRIGLPDVIFSDRLEEIGDPPLTDDVERLEGIPVCDGIADGDALVMRTLELDRVPATGGYVLVCPSTDPCWTPLFVNASALVMEQGGVLSHGAIVAREFGIPAVVNVRNATDLIATGRRIRVDGTRGIVAIVAGVS